MSVYEEVAEHMLNVAQSINKGNKFESLNHVALWNLYIVSSYMYYFMDDPILEDNNYDLLCKFIHDNVESHFDESLYDKDALKAGSGYHINNNNMPYVLLEACHIIQNRNSKGEKYE